MVLLLNIHLMCSTGSLLQVFAGAGNGSVSLSALFNLFGVANNGTGAWLASQAQQRGPTWAALPKNKNSL